MTLKSLVATIGTVGLILIAVPTAALATGPVSPQAPNIEQLSPKLDVHYRYACHRHCRRHYHAGSWHVHCRRHGGCCRIWP